MSEYMTAKELAQMVGVSESKAYCFIRQMNGELKTKGILSFAAKYRVNTSVSALGWVNKA